MAKTYAAFYLPQEEKEITLPNQKNVDRIKGNITSALQNAGISTTQFDIRTMAKNIDLQSTTEFTQKYAVGALTKIINGAPVTNKTMLDSLFNTYAPALNAGLAQTGFNSIVEMKNAVQAGNINVANFVQGFSNGLSVIQDMSIEKTSKYGEEVPIDVVDKIVYSYKTKTPTQKISENDVIKKYIANLEPADFTLKAHIKNENAELWNINDFNNKIIDVMINKKEIIFRLGRSIYENCIISTFTPTINNIHTIDITAVIILNYNSVVGKSYSRGGNRVMNLKPPVGDFDRNFYNLASNEVYLGIIS